MFFPAAVDGAFLRDKEQFEFGLLPFEGTGNATATFSVDITDDFAATASIAEGINSTIAVDITNDFVVAATLNSVNGVTSSFAIDITNDFVVAATLASASPVTSALAADITADFVVEATVQESIGSSLAVDISNDFVVAATLNSSTNVTWAIAADITSDFVVAGSVLSAEPATLSAAVDITADFHVAAVVQNGAFFAIPNIGNPRIGAHANAIRPFPTLDGDAFLPHYWDWSGWAAIEQGGNIASYEFAVDEGDGALVLTDPAQGSGPHINFLQVWIRGGTEGETYVVRCSVTLEDGRMEDASRSLTIASH